MAWRRNSGPVCIVPGCKRTASSRVAICAACWRYLPVETRLAFDGHNDAWRNSYVWAFDRTWTAEDRQAWNAFVAFSWGELERVAAGQAFMMRHNPAMLEHGL